MYHAGQVIVSNRTPVVFHLQHILYKNKDFFLEFAVKTDGNVCVDAAYKTIGSKVNSFDCLLMG